MDEILKKYLAQKAIADFRNGSINKELLQVLCKGEYSGYFRELISPIDKELIFEKIYDLDDNVRIFAGIIIRPIINLYKIDDLFKYWNSFFKNEFEICLSTD